MKIKEETLAVCRKHWISFLVPGFFAFIFLVGGVTELGNEAGKTMVVCGLLLVAYIVLSYMNTYIALTETRLVGHIGIIRSKTLSSPIEAVLSIGLKIAC